jgi:hypothetical protein
LLDTAGYDGPTATVATIARVAALLLLLVAAWSRFAA